MILSGMPWNAFVSPQGRDLDGVVRIQIACFNWSILVKVLGTAIVRIWIEWHRLGYVGSLGPGCLGCALDVFSGRIGVNVLLGRVFRHIFGPTHQRSDATVIPFQKWKALPYGRRRGRLVQAKLSAPYRLPAAVKEE